MPTVSVIVVSFNTVDDLRACLASVRDVHEVIVVDNASTDGSPDMVEREFPRVRLVRNSGNRGFGAANNQGLAIMTGELALLLNSDAVAHPGAVARLAAGFEASDVVAAGGRLQHPDGRLQESAAGPLTLWAVFCEQTGLEKIAPPGSLLSPYWQSRRLAAAGGGPQEVEQVMGACLMMRPVERFDERYFLYCEDTELCHRLRRHGRILYVPEAIFTHGLGRSSSGDRWRSVARYNRGKELTFAIHSGPLACGVCWVLNRLGAFGRLLAWLVPTLLTLGTWSRGRRQVGLFARVLTAPLRGPARPPDTPPGPAPATRPSEPGLL